jgi:hypothetical protein
MSALEIEPAMTYRLQLRGPLESKDGAPPHPYIQYWGDGRRDPGRAGDPRDVGDAWLTRSRFTARGRLRGADDIEYDVYRVR